LKLAKKRTPKIIDFQAQNSTLETEFNEKLKFQQEFDFMFSQLVVEKESEDNDEKVGKLKFKSAFKLFKLDRIAEVKK
jgi:hypothetical protein